MALWDWLTGSKPPRREMHVLVYTRKTCPLCDEALAVLTRYQERYGFALATEDVDASAELARSKYGDCVPVVLIDGQVRFRGHVNEVLLRRILAARG